MDDIDLFSAGIAEPVFDGGLLGETFSNMMGLQFQRVKYGDRFFFDNQRGLFGFSDRKSCFVVVSKNGCVFFLFLFWFFYGFKELLTLLLWEHLPDMIFAVEWA